MTCSKSIVECLRDNNTYPTTFASKESSSTVTSEKALDYTSSSYYNSNNNNEDKYWGVDFTQIVSINSYQIKTSSSGCYWLYKWTASVSINNVSFTKIDSQEGFPVDKIFNLTNPVNARFFKIEGGEKSSTCSSRGMAMYYVKFYGSLAPSKRRKNRTCSSYRGPSLILIQMISLLCT